MARRRSRPARRADRDVHHDHDPRRLPDVLPARGWRPGVGPGDEQARRRARRCDDDARRPSPSSRSAATSAERRSWPPRTACSPRPILVVLGVPFAGPLGVLVFIGGFVPYLGSLATTTVLALVTFAAEGVGGVALLLVLLGASNIAQQRWLVPRVFGPGQRVNPGLALISIADRRRDLRRPRRLRRGPGPRRGAGVRARPSRTCSRPGRASRRDTSSSRVWLDRLAQISWRTLVVLALLAVVSRAIVLPILSLPVILAAILACVLRPDRRGSSASAAHGPTAAAARRDGRQRRRRPPDHRRHDLGLISSLPDVVGTTTLGAGSLNLGTTPVELVRWIGDGLLGDRRRGHQQRRRVRDRDRDRARPDVLPAAGRGRLVGRDPAPHPGEPATGSRLRAAASRSTSCTGRWSAPRSCRSRAPSCSGSR